MYDASYNKKTLARELRKTDIHNDPSLKVEATKDVLLTAAVESSKTLFDGGNPLRSFNLKGKTISCVDKLAYDLVIRKLCKNLKHATLVRQQNRNAIIFSITKLLAEGTPYRIYRLDIRSFYESFSTEYIEETIDSLRKLSTQSTKLLRYILKSHYQAGGAGIPRGLPLSATLSELLMQPFDRKVKNSPEVFFYARYVDDIIIITSRNEKKTAFKKWIAQQLPSGLKLNPTKQHVKTAEFRVEPYKPTALQKEILQFEYLGYSFSVKEPPKDSAISQPLKHFRSVTTDIATKKIKKLKTRISRSMLDFSKTGDFELLKLRIKFLTTNFRVKDPDTHQTRLAGIFYSYPFIQGVNSQGIQQLDKFLKNAILSKTGRIYAASSTGLTKPMKRQLLGHSFLNGHKNKPVVHFHPQTIKLIQECWENE